MSLNETYLIEMLINNSFEISRYFSMFIFLFGTIGNLLNILTLSQRKLREIPCVYLFLISSIFSLISIDFGLITRILSGWSVDPTYRIGWFCKFRTYIVFSCRAMVFWLILLATIDRWLSSSKQIHYRQLSTLKNGKRGTILIIIISMIVYCQLLYCYDANLINSPFKCYTKNYPCQILTDMTFVCFTTIVPIFLMLIFGLLTILNIRENQRRVLIMTLPIRNKNRSKKLEKHLILMTSVQIIVLGILTLPQSIQRLYSLFIKTNNSELEYTIDMFIYNFVLLLTYLATAMPFYIYTLTGGALFRNALLNIIKNIYQFKIDTTLY